MRHREPAICIRASDFSETSQVVHLFTRGAGVVRLLAKGSKRSKSKTGGAIDLISEGELVFIASARGGLGTLVEFSESTSHLSLRKSANKLNASLYMIELVAEMLAESDPHPEIYDLLHNALVRLAQEDAPVLAVLAYFQWRALKHVGLLGEMKSCASCGIALTAAAPAQAFSSRQGGLLCSRCSAAAQEKLPLGDEADEAIALLISAEAGKRVTLPDSKAMAMNRVLAYHVSHQIAKPLRMAKYALKADK